MNHDFRVKSRRLRALLLVCACGLMLLPTGAFPARAAGGSRRAPSALVQTTWPMYGFDPQHTNVNPFEHVLNPGNVSRLTLGWSTHVGSPGQVVESSPAIVDGMIYVNDADRYLDAFDAATHALKWQYYLPNIQGLHSPAFNSRYFCLSSIPESVILSEAKSDKARSQALLKNLLLRGSTPPSALPPVP